MYVYRFADAASAIRQTARHITHTTLLLFFCCCSNSTTTFLCVRTLIDQKYPSNYVLLLLLLLSTEEDTEQRKKKQTKWNLVQTNAVSGNAYVKIPPSTRNWFHNYSNEELQNWTLHARFATARLLACTKMFPDRVAMAMAMYFEILHWQLDIVTRLRFSTFYIDCMLWQQ